MAPHSSTLAWKIPWMEEPGRLQSRGSRRVGHDRVTLLSLFTFMHWRRKWQHTPVFLPGESQGREAWLAAVYEVAQSQTWLKRRSSSSRKCFNLIICICVYVCMYIYIYIYISECCYLYLLFKWHVFQIEHDYEIQVQHNHLQACICSTGLSSKNSFTTMCSSQKLIIIPTKKKKSFYLQC